MAGSAADVLHAGYVLHLRAYRETSAIAELFTREHGRVGAVARGVRGRRARGTSLQQFQSYWLAWRGRGELLTLTQWEEAGAGRRLQGTALVSGLYLNELLVRLLERQDPHPTLFDAYVLALGRIADAAMRETALRLFEKHLLAAIGYGLELCEDVSSGAALQPTHLYRYEPDAGPVPAGGFAADGLSVHGSTLLALAAEQLGPTELREAKRLMRALIHHYLQGRDLVSRTLLRG